MASTSVVKEAAELGHVVRAVSRVLGSDPSREPRDSESDVVPSVCVGVRLGGALVHRSGMALMPSVYVVRRMVGLGVGVGGP